MDIERGRWRFALCEEQRNVRRVNDPASDDTVFDEVFDRIFDQTLKVFMGGKHVLSMAFYSLLLLPYMLAAGYIIVESFRQVFYLSPEVFQQPSWSYYVPHFS